MNQEDRDQIVAKLRELAKEKREECASLETEGKSAISFTVLVQSNTYANLASIFESLRAE